MNQLNCFSAAGGGSRSLSTEKAKSGQRSLKWVGATAGSSVAYTRPSSSIITGNKLKRGGMKLWLYKKETSNGKMLTVNLRDETQKT